ncbi:MAG: hypothetical protein GU362_01975 [Thaumarchaeota archaeon]|jgi:ABC-type antimicrobial peptide transport system permease subunit|nr:hypothetical protein [Nitrososphaerota archaeon]
MLTNKQNYPKTAYTLSLIAGILMILSGIFILFAISFFLIFVPYHRMMFFFGPL